MSNIIEIEEAVKQYRRGAEEIQAIDRVDLNISRGDYLAVVGRSGSGKTTLLNLIGCLDKPTSGRVTVHGMETGELSEKALATIRSTTIGFVFQQFFLIPTLTALENVMVPGRFCARRNGNLKPRARQLLDLVGLGDRADHLPHELSGGEMQRVALARALINEPAILLADEPTGNLDTRSAGEIAEIFRELNQDGLTIVVVTHGNELTGDSTRIVHLLDGRVVEEERLRPVPALKREIESCTLEPTGDVEEGTEAVEVPDYMPSSIKKRTLGSRKTAAAMTLLGLLIFIAAFMPFAQGLSGYQILDQGTFIARNYRGNIPAILYTGQPALLFTGLWPMLLGSLLVVAGILFLLGLERTGRWSAAIIGLLCTIIAASNIIMIDARLGPEISAEYGLWVLLVSGLASLALGTLLILKKRPRSEGGEREA
jgi:putative ABC transport system ATP-binding protein